MLLTIDAEQGIAAINITRLNWLFQFTTNDYPVLKSPLEDFMNAVVRAGMQNSVRYLRHGETYEFMVAGQSAAEPHP